MARLLHIPKTETNRSPQSRNETNGEPTINTFHVWILPGLLMCLDVIILGEFETRSYSIVLIHNPSALPAGCFSESANAECIAQSNGTGIESLLTYYNKTCVRVEELCAAVRPGMHALNSTHCGDGSAAEPLKTILKRVLASEEYYK